MGLLDFLETPQGQALASGIATYAATAKRGTPINNLGRGVLGGVTGYGDAVQAQQQAKVQEQKDAYNKRNQELLEMRIGNEGLRAANERQKIMQQEQAEKSDADAGKSMWNAMFEGSGYDPATLKPLKVSNPIAVPIANEDRGSWSDKLPTDNMVPENVYISPKAPPNPVDTIFDELGYSPGRRKYMKAWIESKPDKALPFIERAYIDMQKRSPEAKDAIAKERAMADAMGIPVGEYLTQKMNKSGQNININNVMPGEAAAAAGKKEGFEIGEQAAAIENKYSAIDSVREARAMLKNGIYSGYWGDWKMTAAKASGGFLGDRPKAANTEMFQSYIGNTVVPRLKEFGGNDSNEEMKYLQKIMGGDITMEPEALSNILESAERKIARGIERLQRQRGALEQGKMPDLGPGPSRGQAKQTATPKLNAKSAPQGVDSKAWQYMTPQERALWK